MNKFRVFIPNKILGNAVDYLKQYVDVDYIPVEDMLSSKEFLAHVSQADGLMIPSRNKITKTVLEQAPHLKAVCNMAVGFDNLDLKALTDRGIYATNAPGVLTETTADLAFGLLLATARRIPEADEFVQQGQWLGWKPSMLLGHEVHGQTLGIIGYGRIGRAIARRAVGFDMQVLYNDQVRNQEEEARYGTTFAERDELIKNSDFVLLQVPLTPETKGIIGAREFGLMKKNAIFINASRGQVIDQNALTQALAEEKIAAAGLDTYIDEPIKPNDPLVQMKNVVTLPHIGSATLETRTAMESIAAKNMIQIFNGGIPDNLVNEKLRTK
ncbi:MAG: D-glycerate dehydrogenase [Bacillota bacterium]|nr:D-glycerate dehydrogenase [Bacillota bacterium]